MEVFVNDTPYTDVEYSIGDVILIDKYGHRCADQSHISSRASFYNKNLKKEIKANDIIGTDYFECDKIFNNVQWKIIDVGVFNVTPYKPNLLLFLTTRNKEKMVYIDYLDENRNGFHIIRKSKKQLERIDIDYDTSLLPPPSSS